MDETRLRAVLGEPAELVKKKIADRLNPLTRQFVERSPFVVVATGRPDGGLDVSPRGPPGGPRWRRAATRPVSSESSTSVRSYCPTGPGTSSPTP
jgi:predicted pyridoxine 5'-phosphate oxidase superfamily flavin-nucleotide-binding protein